MAIKGMGIVVLAGVFSLVVWQGSRIVRSAKPEVLSDTTTRTVEERLASLEARVSTLEKITGVTATSVKKATTSYVSLSGGDITSFDWTKIQGTDFTLDTSLYGKSVQVYWQGWLTNGPGSVRLYDLTNNRAVDFSEFASNSDSLTSFYSKMLSVWRGQNQYFIQGKTLGGIVTLSSPQLKILVK